MICPGILYLIGDVDVELIDRDEIREGETVTFISMIHGG